jgi:hypothetical protein
MADDQDKEPRGGVNVDGDDITVGGDVVGRDKVTHTSTTTSSTTYVSEGGPVARYAVFSLVFIAALAIITIAVFASRPPPAEATRTPTLSPSPSPTTIVVPVTPDTPTPTASATDTVPPPTVTASPTPEPPTDTATPAPTSTATLPPGVTPSPTSAVPVYDAFDDRCLNADRWALRADPVGAETPTPTPLPSPGGCLQADDLFLTEGRNGRLTAFIALESDGDYHLVQTPGGCFREAEVTLALSQADMFGDQHQVFLSVGASLKRRSGDAALEVRLGGHNYTGRLVHALTPRLIVSAGYQDFPSTPYTLGQTITVALRVAAVGESGLEGPAAANQVLTLYVNGQPLSPSFSVIDDPCDLTIGYHSEAQTVLEGFFEEVRLRRP